MGAFISILLSYENLYEDDNSNIDFTVDKYEFTPVNDNENTLSIASTTTDWINFNNTRTYQDAGIELLG